MVNVPSEEYARYIAYCVFGTVGYALLACFSFLWGGMEYLFVLTAVVASSPNGVLISTWDYVFCHGPRQRAFDQLRRQKPMFLGLVGTALLLGEYQDVRLILSLYGAIVIVLIASAMISMKMDLQKYSLGPLSTLIRSYIMLEQKLWELRSRVLSLAIWNINRVWIPVVAKSWQSMKSYGREQEPPFIYTRLEPRQFRLLKLRRRSPFAALQAELATLSIDDPPEFEAISYCWGAPVFDHTIDIQGGSLNITPNAFSALEDRTSIWASRYVWIDSVCINQTDNAEKSHQVAMMGEIYQKAASVVVWLGHSKNASESIDHMIRVRDHAYMYGRRGSEEVTKSLMFLREDDLVSWNIIRDFFKHPWFTRVWIIQEVVRAKQVYVYWGDTYLDWSLIRQVCSVFTEVWASQLLQSATEFEGVRNMTAISDLKRDFDSDKRWPLDRLLSWGCKFAATDSRDKIFGLYDLGSTKVERSLCPNYELDAVQVYTQITKYIYRHVGVDRLLPLAGESHAGRNSKLPSWVPDYSNRIPYNKLCSDKVLFNASGNQEAQIGSSDKKILRLRGVPIDTIGGITDICDYFDETNTETKMKRRLSWMNSVGALISHNKELSGRYAQEIWRILIKDTINETRPAPTSWAEVYDDIIYSDEYGLPRSVMQASLSRFANAGIHVTVPQLRKILRDHQSKKQAGKLDDLKSLWFELLPTGKSVEDVLSFLEALYVQFAPEIAKRFIAMQSFNIALESALTGRHLCVTNGGFIGLVPSQAEVGDQICILFGSRTASVVRPMDISPVDSDEDSEYHLIGEAYVHDFMDGQFAANGTKMRTFVLI